MPTRLDTDGCPSGLLHPFSNYGEAIAEVSREIVDTAEAMPTIRAVCLKEAILWIYRFVSDHGLEGYNGVCQRKLLTAMKQTESYPGESRAFPPTQLEWTTNQRKGKMVLDVYTYKGNC